MTQLEWMLTEEEIHKAVFGKEGYNANIAKAQAKKLVKWLKGHNDFNEFRASRKGAGLLLTIKDWQSLQELAKED